MPPPGDWWHIWFVKAGRGWGKTRTGAEFVRHHVEKGLAGHIALVAPTAADARDVMVEEGDSSLLRISPPWCKPHYEPSKRRVTWPNGATATLYSAEEPDRLRGPQHDLAWADEIASWKYAEEAWDNLMFGLRQGKHPRGIATSTPKPIKLVRDLLARVGQDVVLSGGPTYENADNLAESFLREILGKYEGTTLGRQEIYAELLDDTPGALWTRGLIDRHRVKTFPDLVRVVIGVDPAVTSGPDSAETGILVAGKGVDGRGYVLADRSCRLSPHGWGSRTVMAYDDFIADLVVGEVNNGGDMVEHVIRTIRPNISYKSVRASRGKAVRAQPVASLYEQGRISHVGAFEKLEDQLCNWVPGGVDWSPDRLDALVWALTELMLGGAEATADELLSVS